MKDRVEQAQATAGRLPEGEKTRLGRTAGAAVAACYLKKLTRNWRKLAPGPE